MSVERISILVLRKVDLQKANFMLQYGCIKVIFQSNSNVNKFLKIAHFPDYQLGWAIRLIKLSVSHSNERKPPVSKVCQVSKTRRNKANDICFSNKKHRNFQQPNLQNKKFWDAESKRWVTLRVTTKVIKTITKFGLKGALKRYGTNLNEALK